MLEELNNSADCPIVKKCVQECLAKVQEAKDSASALKDLSTEMNNNSLSSSISDYAQDLSSEIVEMSLKSIPCFAEDLAKQILNSVMLNIGS
jgi:hypothetical protein